MARMREKLDEKSNNVLDTSGKQANGWTMQRKEEIDNRFQFK